MSFQYGQHMNQLVSIITPTYNSEKYIAKTIESIIDQTYKNWELIITDDCSVDNTNLIIQSYIKIDPRIKLFQLKGNSGAGKARNNSIREANGRFIAFCDSDDLWLPSKLESQLRFLNENNLGFTYSSYFTQDEDYKTIGCVIAPNEISYKAILRNNYIGCLTAIYDTIHLGKVYMPNIRKRQDWVLWIKIIERLGRVKGISEPLAIYTVRKNSISSKKLELLKHNWFVYRMELGFNRLKSSFHIIQFIYYYARKKINN